MTTSHRKPLNTVQLNPLVDTKHKNAPLDTMVVSRTPLDTMGLDWKSWKPIVQIGASAVWCPVVMRTRYPLKPDPPGNSWGPGAGIIYEERAGN